MQVFQTLQLQQRRNLIVMFAAGLLFWASLASLLPTLSLYVKQTGGSDFQVGIVIGSFAIGLLIFRPWLGRLADQRDRKLVLLIGLAAVAIAPLGYLATHSIPLLILIRAFHGVSIAAFTTGFSALVTDIAPPQYRGEVIGYMTLVNPIGMAIGPAMGGFLQEWAGYTPLFLLSTGLGVAGILCTLRLNPPPVAKIASTATNTDAAFWRLLLSPRLRTPALVLTLIGLAFGSLAIFIPLFIKGAGIPLNPGLFYTAAAIASFMARFAVGRASDRFGRGRFITLGLALYTIALGLLWLTRSQVGLLLSGFLEGAGSGVLLPMMIALAADRAQPHERGRILGLTLTGFDVGIALAGPIFGYFALQLGYQGIFAIAAGLAFLALLVFITLSSKDLAHSLRFALATERDWYAVPSVLPRVTLNDS